MEKNKMNWIYETPGENINREEYLLGRKVDKYVDPTLQAAEREKHLLATTPGALFAGASVNTTVDLENKIREDPLFEIKKREQEAKKRLANNPIKLKQLRALVDEVKSTGKKKKRKHKHKHSESDDDSEPKSKFKSKQVSSKHQKERSAGRTSERERTDYRQRHRSRSPIANDRLNSSSQHKPHGYYGYHHHDRKSYDNDRRHHRHEEEATVSKKLTHKELEQKRREMMENAEWHAEKRGERVRQHRIEEQREEKDRQEKAGRQEEFVDPLMAETLADATAGTLSDRIQRKIGSVQRTRAALERSFTRK